MINSDPPEEDRLTVLQKIRKSPVLQDLPVIMISDHDSVHDKITAFEEGADDCLIRPFDTIELHHISLFSIINPADTITESDI